MQSCIYGVCIYGFAFAAIIERTERHGKNKREKEDKTVLAGTYDQKRK